MLINQFVSMIIMLIFNFIFEMIIKLYKFKIRIIHILKNML